MATMKDVAQDAGVAVETVSRVLNNRGYISQKTKEKVYRSIERLNYSPSAIARGLAKKDTGTVAIIVPAITQPYYAKMIGALEKQARHYNYQTIVYNSSNDSRDESRILEICQSSFVSGAILISSDINPRELMRYNSIPIVTVERDIESAAASVTCDNEEGGRMAARKLIEDGVNNMIFITDYTAPNMPGDDRKKGFMSVCLESGCNCKSYTMTKNEYLTMNYRSMINRILDENPDCEGIFCTSDVIAASVLQAAYYKNISIPSDIKVIGFDDVFISELTAPPLTTVHQPIEEMAECAVNLVHEVQNGREVKKINEFQVKLVVRATA